MSLRYRLFLWVSGLFLVIAIGSLFMESYVTHRELKVAKETLKEKLVSISEEQRRDLENFLAASITERQVMLDSILNNISIFVPQILRFGPTGENIGRGTWDQASQLLMDYKWIDFIQNTNADKLSSIIVPESRLADQTYRVKIAKGISWIYTEERKEPYLGIEIPFHYFSEEGKTQEGDVVQHATEFVPIAYLLFDLKKVQGASFSLKPPSLSSIPVAWTEGFSLEVDTFFKTFQEALSSSFQPNLTIPPLTQEQLEEKFREEGIGILSMIPGGTLLSTASTEKYMQNRLEETSLRFLQINMIWMLISLYETGMFGSDLFSSSMPEGISLFSSGDEVGMGLKTQDVLFPQPVFADSKYYAENTPPNENSMLGTSLAVVADAKKSHLYLGNTALFEIGEPKSLKKGYLTLAVDTDNLLQKLVLALHRSVFLVYDGKLITGFTEEGGKIPSLSEKLPIPEMLNEKYGLVDWKGESYFFLHMKPFPSIDLHFFVFNPEKVEFALLHDLEQGSEQVVHSILFRLHMAGLIALFIAIIVLHNIARRITEPIVALAEATKEVAKGHYDQVKLQLPPLKHQDEIAVLCHSFEEMVQGLIEKEKVKGVLNKVVSPNIAQEILKGNIHLGGESKPVTVLFADIRGFTKITQHMTPEQVIDLLNTCMTKISILIDQHGGVIDKYVGDEAMALFGAPLSSADSAKQAICTALAILQTLREWNVERQAKGLPSIEMGISIHTGVMLAGNMGAENRLNYTVLGSNVNLAARLCDVAKGMQILITQEVLKEPFVEETFTYEPLAPMSFKGFDLPVEVFSVTGLKSSS